jgi:hypothetical protein
MRALPQGHAFFHLQGVHYTENCLFKTCTSGCDPYLPSQLISAKSATATHDARCRPEGSRSPPPRAEANRASLPTRLEAQEKASPYREASC